MAIVHISQFPMVKQNLPRCSADTSSLFTFHVYKLAHDQGSHSTRGFIGMCCQSSRNEQIGSSSAINATLPYTSTLIHISFCPKKTLVLYLSALPHLRSLKKALTSCGRNKKRLGDIKISKAKQSHHSYHAGTSESHAAGNGGNPSFPRTVPRPQDEAQGNVNASRCLKVPPQRASIQPLRAASPFLFSSMSSSSIVGFRQSTHTACRESCPRAPTVTQTCFVTKSTFLV